MTDRRIVAVMFALVSFGLLAFPDRYTSGTYRWLFDLCSPQLWGAVFATVAVLAAVRRVPRTVMLTITAAVSITWCAGLTAAVITGDAATVTGPAWVGGFAALTLYASTVPAPPDDR